jgi:HD-GYP domain-containing protein (c-di-GMP phosphodiesterase class II)
MSDLPAKKTTEIILPPAGQSSPERPEYLPLPLETLRVDAIIHCQLFLRLGRNRFVKYREPGTPFDEPTRKRLKENGHHFIYVLSADAKQLNDYLEANMRQSLADPSLPEEAKAQVLYTTTVHLVRELMLDPTSTDGVKVARRSVETAVEHILSRPRALASIMDLSSTDYYTYTHSVNVMVYSVALANKLGLLTELEIVELGQSALLHDVGKSFIDWRITNKSGPLTADEFDLMKQHPDFGFQALKKTEELPDSSLFAVRHHHEKLNGTGYPNGLVGPQIELPIRVITCADIYDALTTRRVYRSAIRSYPALELMKEKTGTEIDDRVFRAFVNVLGDI